MTDLMSQMENKSLLQSFVSTMPENVPEMWQKIQQGDFSKGEAWVALEDQILKIYSKSYGNSKAKLIHDLIINPDYGDFYLSLLSKKFGEHVIEW